MKLGLFGGSFDPIHLGHSTIAQAAFETIPLHQLLFIPAKQSPFKTRPSASAEDRSQMIRLACHDLPWASVWENELFRPSPSYSWQTVAWFLRHWPHADLFWILGMDQWESLPRWNRADFLALHLHFLVFPREGIAPQYRPGYTMTALDVAHPASSTAIREGERENLHPMVDQWIWENQLYQG
ncbi:MAG: nicotinate (nicotinamide) nucleotide adenylyltransferase [Verrucomicrobiota bacterium]